jgi:hypothetical protein
MTMTVVYLDPTATTVSYNSGLWAGVNTSTVTWIWKTARLYSWQKFLNNVSVIVSRRVCNIVNSDYQLRHVCSSVSPTIRMEKLGSHWTVFLYDFWYLSIFLKYVVKIQVSLKSDKDNAVLYWKNNIHSHSVLPGMINVPYMSCTEYQNTNFKFYNVFENRAAYLIRWKNIVVSGRSQMTIQRVLMACWISMATNTHSYYVILLLLYNSSCTNVLTW